MPRRTLFDMRWFTDRRIAPHTVLVVLALSVAPPAAADAYTDAIKGEAQKVEGGGSTAGSADGATAAATDPKVAAFEQDLDKQFHGTFLFYQRLPARSREEIYKAHAGGASIDEVRRMVMDRFQHSR
jgi:hypothetical protein